MRIFLEKTCEIDAEKVTGNPMLLENETARNLRVIPLVSTVDPFITVVTDHDPDIGCYTKLRFLFRSEIRFIKIGADEFSLILEKTWPESRSGHPSAVKSEDFKAKVIRQTDAGTTVGSLGDRSETSGGSIIEMVDEIFSRAAKVGASDIHLEPSENSVKIRFRLDGALHPIMSVPKSRQNELISRLKILAHMDIAEKRRPQDGRILVEGKSKVIDVRVSSMPTIHGEKIVMRLLDKSLQKLDLEALGMKGRNLELFENSIRKPHGMVLVTGPTGSGKTTTLYAALQKIHSPEINISTVEDPIEYQIDGINQTQYNPAIDYTFAAAVKTFLRQDPDVIMVGEIRDPETAKYAIQASQTGHMVFSTLHTNDAPGAVVRLLEMGMEPFLVASTMTLIIAQRLLRATCKACGEFRQPTVRERKYLERNSMQGVEKVFAGKGCRQCLDSGYRGRIGVYEMMPVTPEIQELISCKASTSKIRELAVTQGMGTLGVEAIEIVREGVTTLEEVETSIG